METIYDILREMRGIRPDCDDCISNHTCDYLIRFAGRIEKAILNYKLAEHGRMIGCHEKGSKNA